MRQQIFRSNCCKPARSAVGWALLTRALAFAIVLLASLGFQTPDTTTIATSATPDSLAQPAASAADSMARVDTTELRDRISTKDIITWAISAGVLLVALLTYLHNRKLRRENAKLAAERAQADRLAREQAKAQIKATGLQQKAASNEAHYHQLLEDEVCKIRLAGPGIGNIAIDLNETTFVHLRISHHYRSGQHPALGEAERGFRMQDDLRPGEVVQRAFADPACRILLIIGDPGAGKTTLMGYYVRCCLDNEHARLGFQDAPMPFYLPLRDLQLGKDLAWNLKNWADKRRSDFKKEVFRNWLDRRETLVLLDGLDEINDAGQRQEACRWIAGAAASFKRTRLIVTSRSTGYKEEHNIFLQSPHFRADLKDFDNDQKAEFLRKWFEADRTARARSARRTIAPEALKREAASEAQAVLDYLKQNPSLKDLSGIPMLLHLIALVWQEQHSRPKSRIELYEIALNYLLEYRDDQRRIHPPLSARQSHAVLQPVALWMQEELRADEAPQAEMQARIALDVEKQNSEITAAAFCDFLVERAGILARQGRKNYMFRHKSFREYFAGRQLAKVYAEEHRLDQLAATFHDEGWRELLRFFLNAADEKAFTAFFEAFFAAARSRELDAKAQDYLEDLVNEATHRTWDPFVNCLNRPQCTAAQQRYALNCLKRIRGATVAKHLRAYLNAGKGLQLDHAREILAQLEAPAVLAPKPAQIRLFAELPATFRNPFEENAEYILIKAGTLDYAVSKKVESVPNLYFAKYPVTNKLYRRFIRYLAGEEEELLHLLPLQSFAEKLTAFAAQIKGDKHTKGYAEYLGEDTEQWHNRLRSSYDDDRKFNGEEQPVVGVTWYAARAYCLWLSVLETATATAPATAPATGPAPATVYRLPQEFEWERAAAGRREDGPPREYPWPPEKGKPNDKHANYGMNVKSTTPVGRYPEGATPEGLMDMAGNVWEWQENLHSDKKYPAARALRGGSWSYDDDDLRCRSRGGGDPGGRSSVVGFRVVLSES